MMLLAPVSEYRGLDSPLNGHFGSAPCFALVDADSMAVENLSNQDRSHAPGACNPLRALAGRRVDAVVVESIGQGALASLSRAGIRVYRSSAKTVADVVQDLRKGDLSEIGADAVCAGHQSGEWRQCSHS